MGKSLSLKLQEITLFEAYSLQISLRYSMGPKSATPQSQQLFGYPLDQHLNLKHPLIQLASLIDWAEIDKTLSGHFVSNRGRPALPPRLVAGLLYLQHTFDYVRATKHPTWGPSLSRTTLNNSDKELDSL